VLLLAFDTSGLSGSVALLEGATVLAQQPLDPARRSAQTLIPGIQEMLQASGVQSGAIGLVATTIGPGSFTGLRVGVTAAKTLAYALRAELLGLTTLEVLAHQAAATLPVGTEVHAVLDAQRKELFLGRWQVAVAATSATELPIMAVLAPASIVSAENWLAEMPDRTVVTGSGLRKLVTRLPTHVAAESEGLWEPQAATLGKLAWRAYVEGRRDDLWKLAPLYLRPSAAEEKAAP
jgi:tRNA threonylcarbamoyladenosine biosynthesis protein TsaB